MKRLFLHHDIPTSFVNYRSFISEFLEVKRSLRMSGFVRYYLNRYGISQDTVDPTSTVDYRNLAYTRVALRSPRAPIILIDRFDVVERVLVSAIKSVVDWTRDTVYLL